MVTVHDSIIQEDKIRPIKTPGQKRQRRIAIIVVVAIAVIAGAGYYFLSPKEKVFTLTDYETAAVKSGSLEMTTQASGVVAIPVTMSVISPEEGYASFLSVEEGENVTKGQLLTKLDVPDLENELEDLQSDLLVKEQSLKVTEAQDRYEIRKLEQDLNFTKADIEDAKKEVERVKKLVQINSSRQSDLDTAENALTALLRQQETKELSLAETKELADLNIENQKTIIDQVRTNIMRLETRIADARIVSPMNGEILTIEDSLNVPGSLITANLKLFSIADRSSAIVELDVSETYAGLLSPGQKVALTVNSANITGTITAIGKVATASSDGIGSTVTVKVTPDSDAAELLPGASVVSEINIGTQDDVLYLPRGPYLTTGSQRWLYVTEGDAAKKQAVTFGATQGNNIIVQSGVSAGDTIISSGYQNFIQYNTIKLKE